MAADMIQIRELRFAYRAGGFELRIPELRIGDGEKVAVTGDSGAGKTTLVHLIAGILVPDSGEVEVAGLDVTRLGVEDRQDLRALKLGLVFQEFELLEYLDVLDNILVPFRVSPALELDSQARHEAERLAADVGLGDKRHRFPGELSQGERQRVALCRALVTRPAVLLGDEPTGNLDSGNRDHVIDALFEYSERTEAPVVVVTHDRELIDRFDRQVDVMEYAAQ